METRLDSPRDPACALVLAHGAGAGMDHPFMAAVAQGLAARGMAVLRYEFPFMASGSKRPDRPDVAQATVREAVAEAARRWPRLPLFAGGKSFGGRMTSQAQAALPLPTVQGLVFLGFPLHPAAQSSIERAKHLESVMLPLLFVQGTRDALAQPALLHGVVDKLRPRATLCEVEGADHGFHVLKRSGRDDDAVREKFLDSISTWMRGIAGRGARPIA